MISPVLFCCYTDKLLFNLEANGIGCFIGKMFVGELAYADDIVLIAPTSHVMCRMLSTCDSFLIISRLYSMLKIKVFKFEPTRKDDSFINPKPVYYIEGNAIEIVNQWPHLGPIIDNRFSDDDADISFRSNSMIGHINNVLYYFNQVGAMNKLKLFKSYCSSLYSCELWNLFHAGISEVYCRLFVGHHTA